VVQVRQRLVERQVVAGDGRNHPLLDLTVVALAVVVLSVAVEVGGGDDDLVAYLPTAGVVDGDRARPGVDTARQPRPGYRRGIAVEFQRAVHQADELAAVAASVSDLGTRERYGSAIGERLLGAAYVEATADQDPR